MSFDFSRKFVQRLVNIAIVTFRMLLVSVINILLQNMTGKVL